MLILPSIGGKKVRKRRKGGSLHAKKTWARVGGAGGPEHQRAWYIDHY